MGNVPYKRTGNPCGSLHVVSRYGVKETKKIPFNLQKKITISLTFLNNQDTQACDVLTFQGL
jgi:hypothetical protein